MPGTEALRRYLFGRGLPRAAAAAGALTMHFPLTVTKRGAITYGRKQPVT